MNGGGDALPVMSESPDSGAPRRGGEALEARIDGRAVILQEAGIQRG